MEANSSEDKICAPLSMVSLGVVISIFPAEPLCVVKVIRELAKESSAEPTRPISKTASEAEISILPPISAPILAETI